MLRTAPWLQTEALVEKNAYRLFWKMRLIELTYTDGEKFDVNADNIEHMRDRTNNTGTAVWFASGVIVVSETREEIRELVGRPALKYTSGPSWRAPVYGGS